MQKSTGQLPIVVPFIVRKLKRVKLNSRGKDEEGNYYVKGLPVWRYDLVFASSYRTYDTDYVRARTSWQAKAIIQAKHPNAQRFEF
jgi:hypothetical protein